jgi:hypothetical protein
MGRKESLSPNQTLPLLTSKHPKYTVSVEHKWHCQTKTQTGYGLPTQDEQFASKVRLLTIKTRH